MPGREETQATAAAGLSAFNCPECGGRVAYDLTCHTYGQGERWYACMPCDSAIEYFCTEWLQDDAPLEPACRWEYTHGLNPGNPRAAANEEHRPPWLPADFELVQGPLRLVTAFPGVPLSGTDEAD